MLAGRIVQWNLPAELAKRGPIFNVVDVDEGGVETPNGMTPPMLTLQIRLPVERPKHGGEIVLIDFLCLLHPAQQAALESAIESLGGRPQ
jgi:hypothetical protein